MSTSIGRFVAEVGVDVDVASGLNQAVREVQGAVTQINRAADGIKPIDVGIGAPQVQADVAKAISALKALGAEAQLIGRNAAGVHIVQADERQLELVSGVLKRLGVDAQIVTREMAAVAQQTKQVAVAAQQAAVAETTLARATQAAAGSATQVGRSFALINQATGAFTPLGQRAASASVAFGFGLEALARGGAAAEGGVRTALRAIASVAAAFGPQGLIVAGAAAASAAIIDLFTSAREEAEKTRKAFEEEVGRMIRSADTIGLQKKIQEIDIGDPTKGLSAFGDFFKGGRLDLSAQFDELTARINKLKASEQSFGRDAAIVVLLGKLKDVRKELAPMQDEVNLVVRTLKNFPKLPREVTGLAGVTITANSPARQLREDAEAARKALSDLEGQVRRLLDAGKTGGSAGANVTGVPDALVAAYDQATAALKRHGDQLDDVGLRLRAIIHDLRETDAVQVSLARKQFPGGVPELRIERPEISLKPSPIPIRVVPSIDPIDFQKLREQVQRADVLKGLVDLSKAGGDTDLAAQMQALLDDAKRQAEQTAGVIARVLASSGLPAAQQADILQQIKAALAGISDSGKGAAEAFDAIVSGTRGLTQIGQQLGFISDQTAGAIEGLLGVAQAVKSIAAGGALGIIGGVIGGIGGIASIAGAFGQSPLDREHNQLLAQNNTELARLRQDLVGFTNTVGNQQQVARALRDPGVRSGTDILARAGGIPSLINIGTDVIRDSLEQFGLTIADINRIAKDNGIQLLDSEGHIVAGAMKQLGEVIKLNTDLLTKFGRSLDDQRAALDFRREVFDLDTDPTQALRDQIDLLTKFFPDFANLFSGLDASTSAGRAAIEAAFRSVAQALLDGTIPLEAFANVMSKEDLIAIIRDADRALDSFTDTTNAATEALRNVPQWFKIAGFRFGAAAPVGIGPTSVPTPTPIPVLPSVSPALSVAEASRLSGGPTSVTFSGDIVFQVPAGADGPAMYRLWKQEVDRRAIASSNPETRRLPSILPS